MRNSLSYHVLLLFMLILESCSTINVSNLPAEMTPISLDGPYRELKYQFVKKIPLRLDGEEVIANVNKIVYQNDCFYIHDRRQNVIWQFDQNGNLKNKLAQIGPGPNEYVSIRTFDVTNEGLIYILDSHGQKINAYDTDVFGFKFSIPMGFLSSDFGVISKDNIFVGRSIDDKGKHLKLAKIGKDEVKLDPILEYIYENETVLTNLSPSRFYRSGDDVIYYDRFTDAIYAIDRDSIKQVYSMVSSKLPQQEQIENYINKKKLESNTNKGPSHRGNIDETIWDLTNIYITPTWMYMNVKSNPQKHLYVNRETNEVVTATRTINQKLDENLKRCRFGAMGVCNEYFITLQTPEDENDENYSLVLFSIE